MPFEFKMLGIPDVILIEPKIFKDDRGFFAETYKSSDFKKAGINKAFVQDNFSYSKKGVLRGLHYQLNPSAQGKLVRVLKGSIFDVAVDIRKGSPHFGKWVSAVLSEENRLMLWIPEGFAHGFLSLDEGTEVLYKNTNEYDPSLDRGIIWNDPQIGIRWPAGDPLLSGKDNEHPLLAKAESNFVYGRKGL